MCHLGCAEIVFLKCTLNSKEPSKGKFSPIANAIGIMRS